MPRTSTHLGTKNHLVLWLLVCQILVLVFTHTAQASCSKRAEDTAWRDVAQNCRRRSFWIYDLDRRRSTWSSLYWINMNKLHDHWKLMFLSLFFLVWPGYGAMGTPRTSWSIIKLKTLRTSHMMKINCPNNHWLTFKVICLHFMFFFSVIDSNAVDMWTQQ